MPTLPSSSILNGAERDEIARHVCELDALRGPTPANDVAAEQATLGLVTKIMLSLPARRENDVAVEARGEAFMAALDDLPAWAVAAASRRWYRGDAGTNDRGEPFDYHWCPAPAELRSIAYRELMRTKARAAILRRLLEAQPLIEFSDEHCAAMRARIADLFRSVGVPAVGNDTTAASGRSSKDDRGAHCGASSNASLA
jgi:hypothetical protein